MFTGLIEEVGTVTAVKRGARSARVTIEAAEVSRGCAVGDSVAINGTCLTVVEVDGRALSFEAIPETLRRSGLGSLSAGSRVNLERAMAAGQRFGGHLVQGHVDGMGRLLSVRTEDNARVLTIGASGELLRYIASKGSVALDGISLTVVDVSERDFTVWIIPHTWASTCLRDRKPGDSLNIEVDLLARYVERLLEARGAPGAVTREWLAEAGF